MSDSKINKFRIETLEFFKLRVEALERENKRLNAELTEARELLAEVKLVLERFNLPEVLWGSQE